MYLEHEKILLERFNADLSSSIDGMGEGVSHIGLIREPMAYSLKCGGKRVRPMLLIALCEVFGGSYGDSVDFACAIEMIHTYSLIHDDLPSMDDDDMRRGRKTCHIEYGEAKAILAGDGLLNLAYETMLRKALTAGSVMRERYLKAAGEIAESSGSRGMILGQIVDIENEDGKGGDMSVETLDFINRKKTAALLSAAAVAGAYIGGCTDDEACVVRSSIEKIGLSFQITDDVLDKVGDESALGKPVGSDEKNRKKTYPDLLGLQGARDEAKRLTDKAVSDLAGLGRDVGFLTHLLGKLLKRTY